MIERANAAGPWARVWVGYGVPLVLAVLLRVIFLAADWDSPYFAAPLVDAKEFHDDAVAVASGAGIGDRPYDRPPSFTYAVALVYRLVGPDMRAVIVLQLALGVGTIAMVTYLGRRLFGPGIGSLGGALLATTTLPILLEGQLLNETLQTFLLTVTALAVVVGSNADRTRPAGDGASPPGRRRAWTFATLAAVAGAAAILTRPTSVFFVAPVLVWRARHLRRHGTFGWIHLALVGVLFVGVSSLAAVRNRIVSGEWVLVSYNGGINFFVGNAARHHELMDIRPGLRWERLMQTPRALETTGVFRHDPFRDGYAAWDRAYYRAAFEDVASDPPAWIGRLARKGAQFWAAREIDRNVNPSAFIPTGSLLDRATVPFAVLGPLALAGLILLVWRRPAGWGVVALGIGSVWVTCVIFFVTSRYRMPAYPMMALAAAFTIAELARLRTAGSRRAGLWALAALAVAVILGVTDPGRASRIAPARASYLEGVVIERTGNVPGALRRYERALVEYPDDPDVMFSPTSLYLRLGQAGRAAALAERLVRVFPDHHSPYFNLGLAYSMLGRPDDAVDAFTRLLEVKPTQTKARYQLGKSLIDAGRPEEAFAPLRRAQLEAPSIVLSTVEIARAHALLGERDAAIAELRRAFAADPNVRAYAAEYPELVALRNR